MSSVRWFLVLDSRVSVTELTVEGTDIMNGGFESHLRKPHYILPGATTDLRVREILLRCRSILW